jgi:hypothetical protein
MIHCHLPHHMMNSMMDLLQDRQIMTSDQTEATAMQQMQALAARAKFQHQHPSPVAPDAEKIPGFPQDAFMEMGHGRAGAETGDTWTSQKLERRNDGDDDDGPRAARQGIRRNRGEAKIHRSDRQGGQAMNFIRERFSLALAAMRLLSAFLLMAEAVSAQQPEMPAMQHEHQQTTQVRELEFPHLGRAQGRKRPTFLRWIAR